MRRLLAAALVSLGAAAAAAQEGVNIPYPHNYTRYAPVPEERRDEIAFRFGRMTSGSQVTEDHPTDAMGPGQAFALSYLHAVTPRLGFGMDFDMLRPGETRSRSFIELGDSTITMDSVAALLTGRAQAQWGWLRPRAVAGVGMHSTALRVVSTPLPGFAWVDGKSDTRAIVDARSTGLALKFETGLDVVVSEKVTAGVFLAWLRLCDASYSPTIAGAQVGVQPISQAFTALTLGGQLAARF